VLQKAIEVRVETLIARSPEVVWAFVSDFARLPEWLEEFQAVVKETDGPVGEGTVFRYMIDPGGRSGTLRLVEWLPGTRLAWDGPPLGMRIGAGRPRGSHEVFDAGRGRSRLVTTYRPELQGAAVVLAPLTKRWLRKHRQTDAERLKSLLERAQPSRPE
jgi:uncharacterized protein YndB with AHSA1/START domain